MAVECLFEILELPDDTLKKVLPKASARTLVRLLAAYPRTTRRVFLTVLSGCVSRATLEFLEDEMNSVQLPTFFQIRQAESELIKLVDYEQSHGRLLAEAA